MTKIQMIKTMNPGRQFVLVWDFEPLYLGFVSNFDIRISNLLFYQAIEN
jgi:hypothetical protein